MRIVYPNNDEGVAGKAKDPFRCGGCGLLLPSGLYHTTHYGRVDKKRYRKVRLLFCLSCYPFRFPYPGGITLYRDASRTPIEDEAK